MSYRLLETEFINKHLCFPKVCPNGSDIQTKSKLCATATREPRIEAGFSDTRSDFPHRDAGIARRVVGIANPRAGFQKREGGIARHEAGIGGSRSGIPEINPGIARQGVDIGGSHPDFPRHDRFFLRDVATKPGRGIRKPRTVP
jgi:hypothetical protein